MQREGIKLEKVKSLIQSNIRQYTMIIAMLLIWAYFQMATGGVFLMSRNLNNLFLQMWGLFLRHGADHGCSSD